MKTGQSYGVIGQTSTGLNIISAVWYTDLLSRKSIGIVTGVSLNGERKHYIGTGAGIDEVHDAIGIAERGARFYPDVFRNFIS